MRSRLGVALAFVLLLCLGVPAASAAEGPPSRYIVVLNASTSDPGAVARDHESRCGAQPPEHVYEYALKGYAARIPAARLSCVRSDSRVQYVEEDGTATISDQTLPWGIDRINADSSSQLAGNGSGTMTNVNVYVIDSGIYKHSDLNVVRHVNFAGGQNTDCNGHGTHVAGTVAARDNSSYVVGVAPGAPLTGVKVLGCNGSGSWSGVIKGIDWVTANAVRPAVANMSLGGGLVQSVNDAVTGSANAGVFYALAAGNSGANACSYSPAAAGVGSGVMATAAIDSGDNEASWSNYGSCVDISAPGVSVLSTRKGGGTTTMSGTSMASPHVAGTAALYLSTHTGASAADVEAALMGSRVATGKTSKGGGEIYRLNAGGF
jgi:subtilisin family serine protease